MQSVTISNNNYHNKSFEFIGENKTYKKINPTIPIFIVMTSLIASPVNPIILNKPHVSYAKIGKDKTYTFYSKNDTINIEMDNRNEEEILMSEKFHAKLQDSERYLLNEIITQNIQIKDDLSGELNSISNKIDQISSEINDIKISIVNLNNNIDNLPDKLKASKIDFWGKSVIIPGILSILVAVVTGYVMIKLGLQKP